MLFGKFFEERKAFVSIVNGKIIAQSGEADVSAEQVGTEFMKGAEPDVFFRCEDGEPFFHFVGGFVGKS